jgi:membrane protease YdiL (CAAX protease family)
MRVSLEDPPDNRALRKQDAFWNYEDLTLFVGAILPAWLFAMVAIRPIHFSSQGLRQIVFQVFLYLFLAAVLYVLIARRYHRPFWRSLGWNFDFRGAWLYALIGPPLALGLAALGAFLRAPENATVRNLMTDRVSTIAVVCFGAFVGPICEEMAFRGFLQPLLTRSLGAWPAIVLADVPFALLHGPAWQSIGIIAIAGLVLGYVRYRTGSTAASALVHVGYNATLFVGFLITRSV